MTETENIERGCAQSAIIAAFLLWSGVILIGGTIIIGRLESEPGSPAWLPALLLLTAGLLLVLPAAGTALITRRIAGWRAITAIAGSLAAIGGYLLFETVVRAMLPGNPNLAATLNLLVIIPYTLLATHLAPQLLGTPTRGLVKDLNLHRLAPSTFLLALALAALLALPGPLTGALGDRFSSLEIVFQTLARVIPQLLLFWGLVFHLLASSISRRWLAGLMMVVVYLIFSFGGGLPAADWGAFAWQLTQVPLAILLTELRAREGGLYVLFPPALAYYAIPLLFIDPRDLSLEAGGPPIEYILSQITVVALAAILGLGLWGARKIMQSLDAEPNLGVRLAFTTLAMLLLCGSWGALYAYAGEPGFTDDSFLIILEEQADLGAADTIANREARLEYVYQTLAETAERTQAPLREELDELGIPYRPYYIINMIRVDGNRWLMGRFEKRPGVAQVILNPNVREYPGGSPAPYDEGSSSSGGVQSNLSAIHADQAWELGVIGEGIVVAGQDTGYDWTHPALQPHYRGWDGQDAEHDYNWHDAWDDTAVPFDDDSHGTHTMGTVLGDDGDNNRTGVAPGARWIGCRNMRRGFGNPGSYAECMEFFLAPYPHGGDPFHDGNVRYAPHVINNSWGCPDFEGCFDDTLEPAVIALRAAGIMMVVSAGNDGPACNTANEPPARYDAVFSVGATDDNGDLTGFSSRGPVGDLLKPDITAPGDWVRSSVPGGNYAYAPGTSMAGPHVVGVVALLWSADPDLIGDIDATEALICRTAEPHPVDNLCTLDDAVSEDDPFASMFGNSICACGEVTGVPNNLYGCGFIDAGEAVREALGK